MAVSGDTGVRYQPEKRYTFYLGQEVYIVDVAWPYLLLGFCSYKMCTCWEGGDGLFRKMSGEAPYSTSFSSDIRSGPLQLLLTA